MTELERQPDDDRPAVDPVSEPEASTPSEPESVVTAEPEVAPEPEPAAPVVAESEASTPSEPEVAPAQEPEPAAPLVAESEASTPPEPEVAPEPEPAQEPEPAAPVVAEPEASTPPEPEVAPEPEPEVAPVAEPPAALTPEPSAPVSHLPPPPPGPHEPAAPSDAGKIVSGTVTAVEPDELSITLLDGRPAVLARRHWDLHPVDDLTKVIEVNDLVEAAILARDDPKKRVVLSRAWSLKTKAWDAVTKAADSNAAVKARVTSISPKGLVVDVHGLRGFVPASHLSLDSKPDFAEFADQTLELKVLEVDQKKERLVLSRRSQLLREQRKETHDLLTKLAVDQVVTGTVASLAEYGAFVDLGGVKGLVHLSELSWQRVGHPRDVLSVGQQVEVRVLDVKVKKRRVSLSLRKTSPDPLSVVAPGSVVSGPVTRLVDFGAFVDLGGVEGLVHLSELAEYRVSAPEEIVTPGEVVMVKVLSVDKRRRRIELSIRQAVSDHYGD